MFRGLRLGQAGEILQYAKRGAHSAGSVIIQGMKGEEGRGEERGGVGGG